MKRILFLLISSIFFLACNNAADSNKETPHDSLTTPAKDNMRSDQPAAGDTASYERMQQKMGDSIQ